MPIDIKTPNSPGWWLKQCYDKLAARADLLTDLYGRYDGDAKLPPSMASAPEAARTFFRTSRTNFAEMIVKAVLYRLRVAFIMTAADSDETGDADALRLWRAAGMVQASKDSMRNALIAGDGYLIATMRRSKPIVTAEDPRNTVTIHDPVFQSEILALGKFYHDPIEPADYALLRRPGRVFVAKFPRKAPSPTGSPVAFGRAWQWDETVGGEAGQALPMGEDEGTFTFRLRDDEGVGEFRRHRDPLDRIDHLVLQGMVIATLQAFKQRGIFVSSEDMPDEDPDTGQLIDYNDIFTADPAALWKLPETAKMWESGAVDTTPIVTMVTKEMEKLAAVTFTSMSVFTPEGANQSAQGASLVREGQTFKIEDRQERFGDTFAQVAAAIFKMAGRGDIADPDTIRMGWASPERYGLSERAQAAFSAAQAGVPWRTIMRDIMGYGPEQVDRMMSERMEDMLLLPAETTPAEPGELPGVPGADANA